MESKKKIVHIIGALAIFLLTLFAFFLTGKNLISYAIFFIVFVNVTGYYPKCHDGFVKYLGSIWFF
ncbi:hypothetical protein [Photorhabdus heterorhabditis]|uniref:hypothetical protein n=1 Tax=Photorhabdus heterorhabditis TaxID=880156 RepID=UPI0030DD1985